MLLGLSCCCEANEVDHKGLVVQADASDASFDRQYIPATEIGLADTPGIGFGGFGRIVKCPEDHAAWPPVYKFCATVQRAPDVGLGLGLAPLESGGSSSSLVVRQVSEGPLRDWNSAPQRKPSDMVRPGDRITAVNGSEGSDAQLVQLMKDAFSLELRICRQLEYKALTRILAGQAAGCDLDLSAANNGEATVRQVQHGSPLEHWNFNKPEDLQIRPGDMLLAVNDQGQGMGGKAIAELLAKASGDVELLLRRPKT